MKKKFFLNSMLLVFAAVFAFSAYKIIDINTKYKQGRDEYNSVFEAAYIPPADSGLFFEDDSAEETPTPRAAPLVDHNVLKEMNGDYIGWIDIPGSPISYPIVSGNDNDYYLNHTFLRKYNEAGCVFLDYRTGSFDAKHVLIYGHRMRDGSMFGALGNYLDSSFYSNNKYIHIYTSTELLVYEVFAAREVYTDDECYNLNFASDKAFGDWLKRMKSSSLYETDLILDESAKAITLSTCVTGNKVLRCVVQAQLIERYKLVYTR